jgi:replication factor C subunit 1
MPFNTTVSYGYQHWQAREAPPNLGQKELPKGKPYCLYKKVFVFTGVLDSLEREDAFKLVEHYGGTVVKSVTKNCTHAVVGMGAGAKKLEKIKARKDITMIDEDGLFNLIRTSPGKKLDKTTIKKLAASRKTSGPPTPSAPIKESQASTVSLPPEHEQDAQMWVDKYKPRSTRELIGNPGPINKLTEWLKAWTPPEITTGRGKGKASAKGYMNAALLSGPPGIGKTSAAHLVARECGYEPIEYNASDTRSKKLIQENVANATDNKSISEFWSSAKHAGKTVLIMDEVDGMSSGDRGGMAEIIALIKKTQIPIICVCNDRASPKVRSLANYCLDLHFRRPTTAQIQARISQILRVEGLEVDPAQLPRIIESVHGDVRQLLNLLQMWSVKSNTIRAGEVQQRLEESAKNVELGPFDVIPKLFNANEASKMSLEEKISLYFVDQSLVPLLVQENYVKSKPRAAQGGRGAVQQWQEIDQIARAADVICDGDLADLLLHKEQEWELSPTHAFLSTVLPAHLMTGHLTARIDFPRWLGKYSNRKKQYRLLTELSAHMSSVCSGDKNQIRLDYLPNFVAPLTRPLIEKGVDGIPTVLEFMDHYSLTREDWDSIMEIAQLKEDRSKNIQPKVKAAFTRKYNAAHMAVKAAPTRKGAVNFVLSEVEEENPEDELEKDEDSAQENEDKIDKEDRLITQKKVTTKRAAPAKPKKTGGGRGSGRRK